MKKFIIALTIFSSIAVPFASYRLYLRSISTSSTGSTESTDPSPVLGAKTEAEQIYFNVNVPSIFNRDIKAPNVVYTVRAGEGIVLSGDAQAPTISNTGILELVAGNGIAVDGNEITSTITQGLTSLSAGTGISVDGNKITNSGIISLTAGTGISVSGSTITNTGITSLTAGTGISISGSTITNTYSFTPDYTQSGWTDNGASIVLTTLSDSVEVGALSASSLEVSGTTVLGGNVTIANGVSILPSTDLGSDIGSSTKRINNIWAANINSNSSQAFSGQTTFSYAPTDTTITQASVIINPTTAAANGQLLGLGIAGYQRALIDEDGDIILGYSDATSAPSSDLPLNIYGHSGTRVASIDTLGNLIMGESLTTSGDLAVNTDKLFIESTNGNVGIGTITPTSKLAVIGDITAAVATGIEGFRLTDTSDNTKLAYTWTGSGLSMDIPGLASTNLLTNGTFESDITTGGYTSYTLNDQFTTDLPAGSVNGTSAEPTGGTRTVVDTLGKLSLEGGALTASGGGSWGDPGIYYNGISRSAGIILLHKLNISDAGGYAKLGFTTTQGNSDENQFYLGGGAGNLRILSPNLEVGTSISDSTEYETATILKGAGAYHFIKGGTEYPNWTFVYNSNVGNTSTLYPGINGLLTAINYDNIRIPTSTWLPTPLAYDTFTRGDGAIGSSETTGPDSQTTPSLAWTGGAISGNKVVITPSLGSELITNGDMSSSAGWTLSSGWTIGSGVLTAAGVGQYTNANQTGIGSTGEWYLSTIDVSGVSSGTFEFYFGGAYSGSNIGNGAIVKSRRATTSAGTLNGVKSTVEGQSGTFDNFSIKAITPSSLFSTVSTSDSDVIADANVTMTAGTQAGLVLNLDSTSSPANFIIVYHNGTQVIVDEAVNGVYTNKQATTVTYSAGATLRAIREGTKLRVYYNNALVGSELTMTANTNTKHGLFSTYSGNSFDNFTLWARGTGSEYEGLVPDTDLTATRDTTIHYSGSSSLKLVAGASDNGYTQPYTLPDTSTYTLSAFVYTDGSAVTSADASLLNGSATLDTNYTSVGNGWYKLSASFAGVASSRNYGVKVKAGKTVYVDNLSLYASTSSSVSTLAIGNSTTGLGGLSVEATTTLNSGLPGLQALVIKGSTSQTEDLTEWQDSTGTVLSSVTSSGYFVTPQVNAIDGTGLKLYDDSGNGIFVEDGGNVGIGTANPAYKLDVAGTVNATGATTLGSTLDIAGLTTIASTSGTDALVLTSSGSKVLGLATSTNNATLDLINSGTEPTNLLTNSTFDSDLTSWSEVPSYTLNDQFTTDLAAGSVNGTSAEPTGGTRTVVDTNSKLSITGGQASFATGGSAAGNPGLLYSGVARGAGKVVVGKININPGGNGMFGFDTNTAGALGEGYFLTGGSIRHYMNSSDTSTFDGAYSDSTDYYLASVMKSTGMYYFIKGGAFTNWTLLYISPLGATATLYPGAVVYASNGEFTADNIRIPTSTWLPTPLAYTTFTTDGSSSTETTGPDGQTTPALALTGGTVSGGSLSITPTLGSDVIVNGTFDTDTNWTKEGGWTIAGGVASHAVGGASYIYQTSLTNGLWYKVAYTISNMVAGSMQMESANLGKLRSSNGAYVDGIRGASSSRLLVGAWSTAGFDIDDIIAQPLTLSSLFSTVSTSDADVIADAGVTLTSGTQAGLVLNLDDTDNPANFIIVYHDGTSVKVDEAVAGVYTNKQTTTVTYSAGATLRAIRSGTKLRVYYNNALVGSELTMTANTNTNHGLFSTYEGNSFDNFTLFPRGTGNEFASAPFEELTATAETTTTYNNSDGSVQLVASGTDGNYLQSVNVGDTSTYTLMAYAYTDGSAVTSSDAELWYDTGTITTTYTPMGGTGWYRLSGTLTGEASAKDYGVRVKAGTTVYVDEMKLQVGTGTTQTLYVTNSGTGITGLNVQGTVDATINGVATLVKAGTISDSDFTDAVRDGLFGFDTTNHRLYFREGGVWSYIARTAGFQVPVEEIAGLSGGDYLLPYVESFMADGAVHGMYQKFDLNKVMATQGAVTFTHAPSFPSSMGGMAIVSTFSSQVDVKFAEAYPTPPIVNITLVTSGSDTTFIEDGQKAYVADVTTEGFRIMLPTLAIRDFTYHWTALGVSGVGISRSEAIVPIATPEPTLTPEPPASESAGL